LQTPISVIQVVIHHVLVDEFSDIIQVTMGIQGHKQVLFMSSMIELVHLIAILRDNELRLRSVAHDNTGSKITTPRQPCVVIVANQIGMKFLKSSGSPMNHIGGITCTLLMAGIDVIIATDSAVSQARTKRASVEWKAGWEKARIIATKS